VTKIQNQGKSTEEKEKKGMRRGMRTRRIIKLEFFCINCIQFIKFKIQKQV